MPGPLLPLAIAGGVAGLVAYLRRRRLGREGPALAELAVRLPGARMQGDTVTVLHDGLPVEVSFGVPPYATYFERGLLARAPYAIGGGPRFSASARDVSAHGRRSGPGYPLSARFERGYDIIGDHQEARALVLAALAELEVGYLPAPYFVADGAEVAVFLPEFFPDGDALEVTKQLVAFVGELARFGIDRLERLRAEIGGSLVVQRAASPSIYIRTSIEQCDVFVALTWCELITGAHVVGLTLSAPRGPRACAIEDAIATFPTVEERRAVQQLMTHCDLRSSASQIDMVFTRLLRTEERTLALRVLTRLSGQAHPDAPFR